MIALRLVACGPGAGAGAGAGAILDEESVSIELSETIVTLPTLSVATHVDAAVTLEYGTDNHYGRVASLTGDGTLAHELQLFGLASDTTWHFRLVAEADGAREDGADHAFSTGALPAHVASLDVLTAGEPGPPWIAYSYFRPEDLGSGASAVYVMDGAGDIVWYTGRYDGMVPQVSLVPDGTGVLFSVEGGPDAPDTTVIEQLRWDGSSAATFATPNGHHAFTPMPDLSVAWVEAVQKEIDGVLVVGDAISETARDGTTRQVWNAFDHLVVEEGPGWDIPASLEGKNWTHANGIAYDPVSDDWLLSLLNVQVMLRIDRATGDIVWTIGDPGESDFTFADGGYEPAHAPEFVDGGILVFENANPDTRACRYDLDAEAGTATEVFAVHNPDGGHATIMGDLDLLPDGGVLTAWGDLGEVMVSDTAGVPTLRFDTEAGTIIGQAEVVERFGP